MAGPLLQAPALGWSGLLAVVLAAGAVRAGSAPDTARLPPHRPLREAKARALDKEGHRAHDRGDYPAAAASFDAALELSPDPALLLDRARTRQQLQLFREAADDCKRLLGEFPGSEQAGEVPRLLADLDQSRRRQRLAQEAAEAPLPGTAGPAVSAPLPPPPPPEPVRSYLQVKTDRAATLLVDGAPLGPADGESHEVAAGVHQVSVAPAEADRYRPFDRQVEVPLGTTQRVEERLVPRLGKLAVSSTPPGAAITIDGAPQGVTPLAAVERFPGPVQLALKLDRYLEWSGSGTIQEGRTASIAAELRLDPVRLAADRSRARTRAALWALGGALALGAAGASELRAHGFSNTEAAARDRYRSSTDPAVLAASSADATAAASSAKTAQTLALGLAAAAAVPLAIAAWTLVSAP